MTWTTEGLGGDAFAEDAGQALGLAGGDGVQKSAEESFLLELEENISVLSELLEEGMDQKDKQNKEEMTTLSGVTSSRQESPPVQSSLGNTSKISPAEKVAPHANLQHSDPIHHLHQTASIHYLHHHPAQGGKEIYY